MNLIDEFRHRVETFLDTTGMAPSLLGELACNDRAFVLQLRKGREPRIRTMEKVDAFIRAQRPPAKSRRVA